MVNLEISENQTARIDYKMKSWKINIPTKHCDIKVEGKISKLNKSERINLKAESALSKKFGNYFMKWFRLST